jgi:site-specific DNA-cytosine methylase
VFHVLKLLSSLPQAPRLVMLENVPGILQSKFKPLLKDICDILKSLGYVVKLWMMNPLDYTVPHDRPRLFIIGLLKIVLVKEPVFPKRLSYLPSLSQGFLDVNGPLDEPGVKTLLTPRETSVADAVTEMISEARLDTKKHPVLIDVRSSAEFGTWHVDKSPCLTKNRGMTGGFWLHPRGSMLMTRELGHLMGLPQEVIDDMLETGLGREIIGAALGNGQSINILERLFCSALRQRARARWGRVRVRFTPAGKRWQDERTREPGHKGNFNI